MLVLVAAVVFAYNYSLETLVQSADLETPLAYVSLVPVIALLLAAVRARPLRPEPAIHDRQIDYIVGIPLVVTALAANLFLPNKLSIMFWVWRIDLLTMPIFVAGAVTIIFGVRVLWRQKLAIGYLFLAWPYPYQSILLRVLDGFTTFTVFITKAVLTVVPVARAIPAPSGTLFSVSHHGTSFPLSVVSACSGVNSVIGFLLVGSACGAIVRGPFVRKALWMAGGLVLLWTLNLVRIIFIFWSGELWGEHVAIGILHPFIGLVTFSLGVLVMMLLIEPLGMNVNIAWGSPSTSDANRTVAPPSVAVPRAWAALALVTVAAIVLAITNIGLENYNLVADTSGAPKLASFISAPTAPNGWGVRRIAVYDWAKPLFGDTSQWSRYTFIHREGGNLITSTPVVADVVVSPDLSSFSAYGVEACYQFHGYTLRDVAEVSVGGGITGQTMSYTSATYGSWSIVYWIIPVKSGSATNYERTILYVRNSGKIQVVSGAAAVSGIQNLTGTLVRTNHTDAELIANRSFLVALGRELIKAQASHHSGATVSATRARSSIHPSQAAAARASVARIAS